MSKRATDMHPHPFAAMVKAAWKASGYTIEEVVFRYKTEAISRGFEETGNLKGHGAVKSWCYGWSIPQLHQYDVLAAVLNEGLAARGETESLLPRFDAELVGTRAGGPNGSSDQMSYSESATLRLVA